MKHKATKYTLNITTQADDTAAWELAGSATRMALLMDRLESTVFDVSIDLRRSDT